MLMKTKSWETISKVSVQDICETHYHETKQSISKMNSLKHENHQSQIDFKVYVCHVQTKVYIRIQTWKSPQKYMHKGKWL